MEIKVDLKMKDPQTRILQALFGKVTDSATWLDVAEAVEQQKKFLADKVAEIERLRAVVDIAIKWRIDMGDDFLDGCPTCTLIKAVDKLQEEENGVIE